MKTIQLSNLAILIAMSIYSFNATGQFTVEMVPIVHNNYNISCFGGRDGRINLNISNGSGHYQFHWSNEAQTSFIEDLQAGYYHVTVYDLNPPYESAESEITLTEPEQLLLYDPVISSYPSGYCISLFGACNGSIQINPNGGTSPYTYLWHDGNTSHNRWSLCQGQYSVTVTDINGCSVQSEHYYISEPPRSDWSMTGNSGITSSQFIGSTDNTELNFKTNNVNRLKLMADGHINLPGMIGTTTRMMLIDGSGNVTPGEPFDPGPTSPLCNWHLTNPWHKANSVGPSGAFDVINCDQRFGFGVINPLERIHAIGFARFGSATNYLNIGFDGTSKITSTGGELLINSGSTQNVTICNGGGIVSIGEVTPLGPYKLFVRDGIRTEKVKVDVASVAGWADYVFKKDYQLMNLTELDKFIRQNKHLPGVPTENEILISGIDLGETQAMLLKKIEELTLYVIELQKEVTQLQKR